MEPACSLTVPSLFGSSGLVREKQLFEKFWKGTFKAVATPRLESVIVASITARTRKCNIPALTFFLSNPNLNTHTKKKIKIKNHVPFAVCFSCRSPSYSLSPVRKKKKKKKKSSKKSKRHRCALIHSQQNSALLLQVLEAKDTELILKPRHDYDSGNDTSSPPSCKTAVCERKRSHSAQRLASPDKHKFTDRDNGSDSGNSVTSYDSLCKTYREDSLSTSSCCSHRSRRKPRTHRSRSPSSSSSRSSMSSRHYSRSVSLSSCSSYSRSPSSSSSLWHRGSSRGSSCRHSMDRRTSSSRESKVTHSNKKRRRRKSYSPMRKRRRDSPSHLEARRITRYVFFTHTVDCAF
ncbi:hypothetical protein NL108_011690 [Boleophthalmus pectinirostris]|nr:hypothetical protein NL108_011690 [Boleophthalmus pectinirostris]